MKYISAVTHIGEWNIGNRLMHINISNHTHYECYTNGMIQIKKKQKFDDEGKVSNGKLLKMQIKLFVLPVTEIFL